MLPARVDLAVGGKVAGREGGFFGKVSAAEYRRIAAETYYETEKLMEEERDFWGESPVVHDAEHAVYRFKDDGVFAFGPETINERELIRRGLWEGPSSEEKARSSYRIRVIAYLLHRPMAKGDADSSDGIRGIALAGLRDLSNTQYATVQADSV